MPSPGCSAWRDVCSARSGARSVAARRSRIAWLGRRSRRSTRRRAARIASWRPVYTRLVNLALAGHPTIYESEQLSYRTLPSTAANEKLFDLAVQHPQARVVSQVLLAPSSGPPGRR
jgi:hypothetical protein